MVFFPCRLQKSVHRTIAVEIVKKQIWTKVARQSAEEKFIKNVWNIFEIFKRLSHNQHPPSRSHSVWSWRGTERECIFSAAEPGTVVSSNEIKQINKKWRWTKKRKASEVFKEQTSQSTYNIHPDLRQDVHSVTKFDDEIRWWKKSVTKVRDKHSVRSSIAGHVWWYFRYVDH